MGSSIRAVRGLTYKQRVIGSWADQQKERDGFFPAAGWREERNGVNSSMAELGWGEAHGPVVKGGSDLQDCCHYYSQG